MVGFNFDGGFTWPHFFSHRVSPLGTGIAARGFVDRELVFGLLRGCVVVLIDGCMSLSVSIVVPMTVAPAGFPMQVKQEYKPYPTILANQIDQNSNLIE